MYIVRGIMIMAVISGLFGLGMLLGAVVSYSLYELLLMFVGLF